MVPLPVPGRIFRSLLQRIQRSPNLRFVAAGPNLLEPRDLTGANPRVVDLEDVMLLFLGEAVAVDSDDHRLARVDPGRARRGGFLDAVLRQPFGDRFGHSAM